MSGTYYGQTPALQTWLNLFETNREAFDESLPYVYEFALEAADILADPDASFEERARAERKWAANAELFDLLSTLAELVDDDEEVPAA